MNCSASVNMLRLSCDSNINFLPSADEWCEHPPENSVPNGQLEVSHSKAVLHCKEGFREKDGRDVYATCENNTWSFLSLECVGNSWRRFRGSNDFPKLYTYVQGRLVQTKYDIVSKTFPTGGTGLEKTCRLGVSSHQQRFSVCDRPKIYPCISSKYS
ncbi:hypothetical protein AVEN_83750-1 [Araneus ventricosus]|uniref:Sushi domain-containing protein n=1 Tax=Araneus ventricosus TaxID=182803 RepID=A0A4Y2EWW2_ARAVE|nr:hypothetical protein AVEN_83750-1 [Araneus ventricosus]